MAQHITSEAELTAIYGPHDTVVATIKEIDHISDHYRMFIDISPFVLVATSGPGGLDCTPRGDPAGFVRVVDKHIIMLPDRRGNNRIDTLRNLVHDPRIALLFLIPGIGRMLRVNGRAKIRVDEDIRRSFTMEGKVPRSVIVVTAERVYTHCPRFPVGSGWHGSCSDQASAGRSSKSTTDSASYGLGQEMLNHLIKGSIGALRLTGDRLDHGIMQLNLNSLRQSRRI